jgi:transposase-like protein
MEEEPKKQRKPRKYDKAFKREAVRLVVEEGYTQAQVERDLDISDGSISSWRKAIENNVSNAFVGKGHQRPEDAELSQLRRENKRLREERDILKKAMAILIKERYVFIERHSTQWRVGRMCQVLSVSSSGYYNWQQYRKSKPIIDEKDFLIRAEFDDY